MAQVVARHSEFKRKNVNIVAVSFGTPEWAKLWLEQTQAPIDIWLDATRNSYLAYGLTSSVWASWGPRNLWYYAQALWRGEKLQEHRGDTNQLGGNFIVDAHGTIRFVYRSQDPTDRPSIDALLEAIDALDQIGVSP